MIFVSFYISFPLTYFHLLESHIQTNKQQGLIKYGQTNFSKQASTPGNQMLINRNGPIKIQQPRLSS